MEYRIRIRNLREDHDRTQQEIAEYLGTSQTMYARYERGANEMPIRHLISLARYYNVDMNYICGLSSQPNPFPTDKTKHGKCASHSSHNRVQPVPFPPATAPNQPTQNRP